MLKDIVSRKLVACDPDSKVSYAAKLMDQENVGCVLILDNDKPRGLLTDRDIVVRCVAQHVDVDDTTVENVMTESLATVRETDGIFDCIEIMHGAKVRRIPVVDEMNHVVGIVSFDDLLSVLGREMYELSGITTRAEEAELKKAA